ncbi:MAG: hypothetical protein ABFS56_03015 [Pseudomonadota bacterium]
MKNPFLPYLFMTVLLMPYNADATESVLKDDFEPPRPEIEVIADTDTSHFFFEPRLVTGKIYEKYEENYAESDDILWQDNVPFIGIGLTLGKKNFSVDIYAQQSESGKDSFIRETSSLLQDYNATLSRKDYALNLSYIKSNLFSWDHSLVFSVGYKIGQTDIGVRTRNITNQSKPIIKPQDIQFETKGPTIGLAYGFPVGNSVLGINLGYAWLNTAHSNSSFGVETNPASTSGITVGFLWAGSISKNFGYSLSLDGYSYTMGAVTTKTQFKDQNGNLQTREIKLNSIEESVMTFKFSLSYSF